MNIQFPPPDVSSNDPFMKFENMTPMIQIPSSVIMNQIAKEGTY